MWRLQCVSVGTLFKTSHNRNTMGWLEVPCPRSESVKATIAEIAHSVGAPLSWVPPADMEPEDATRDGLACAQSLRVHGFNHILEARSVERLFSFSMILKK